MPANLSISLKIFLIEDSIPGRGQLAALFGNINGVDVVGEAETMDAATSRVEVCGPAVAVMDFHLAQGTAMHVIAPVAESDRSLITIVLTNDATAIVREAAVEQEQTIFLQDRENQSGTRHHRGNRPQP